MARRAAAGESFDKGGVMAGWARVDGRGGVDSSNDDSGFTEW